MGKKLDTTGIHRILRHHLDRCKLSICPDVCNLFELSKPYTYKLLKNPNLLTRHQFILLAGLLNIPAIELFAMVHTNSPKLDNETARTLSELSTQYE